ncbi:class I SAM-dependent methyltransferase [Hymenobacter terricola]|uniref:class I SAM-dependent methyltransferase n=1 Tax=Hymenobacter terricola TaxID=2819236 RepID=UPI001B309C0B|nr:class I SAM-dependent methyltransferase [Hymenobacter terricola]
MNIQTAYNAWAETYDAVLNKTRDLEGTAFRQMLAEMPFAEVLEIGCGTGKNTEWLAARAAHVTAVDFSAEMLRKAQEKPGSGNITFQQADITREWAFAAGAADLVTCSLLLEHVQDLGFVFQQAGRGLKPGGLFYFGELHPFKQYLGSKARFEQGGGTVELECFVHHVSDYMAAASKNGFSCMVLREWFDDDNRNAVPRIISFIFQLDNSKWLKRTEVKGAINNLINNDCNIKTVLNCRWSADYCLCFEKINHPISNSLPAIQVPDWSIIMPEWSKKWNDRGIFPPLAGLVVR